LRSTGFQVETAKFRHYGEIKIYKEQASLVSSDTLESTIPVWFSFIGGSGLNKGMKEQVELKDSWRQVQCNDVIVFRFQSDVHNAFMNKKTVRFEYNNTVFSILEALNLNGENIYSVCGIESVS